MFTSAYLYSDINTAVKKSMFRANSAEISPHLVSRLSLSQLVAAVMSLTCSQLVRVRLIELMEWL